MWWDRPDESPFWYGDGRGTPAVKPMAWQDTPRWLFWKPTKRRVVWNLNRDGMWLPSWEYQHPAYVAREFLRERFDADAT